MTDDDLAERLAAVERRLDAAYPEPEDRVEAERVEAMAERLADLEGTVEALEGYVGEIERVDDELERRADAALAVGDDLEARLDELEETVSTLDDAVGTAAPDGQTEAQPAAATPRPADGQPDSVQRPQCDDSSRAFAAGTRTAEAGSSVSDDRSDDVDARHRPATAPADRKPVADHPSSDRNPAAAAPPRPTAASAADERRFSQASGRSRRQHDGEDSQRPRSDGASQLRGASDERAGDGGCGGGRESGERTPSVSGWGSNASSAPSTSADGPSPRDGHAVHHDAPASGQPTGWRATGSDDPDLGDSGLDDTELDDWSTESDRATGDEPGETLFERLRTLL